MYVSSVNVEPTPKVGTQITGMVSPMPRATAAMPFGITINVS